MSLMPDELGLSPFAAEVHYIFSTIQRISFYLFSKNGHDCVLKVEVIFEDPISTSVGCQILAKDVNFQMKVGRL